MHVSSTNTDPNVLDWQANGLPPSLTINNVTGVITGTIADTVALGNYAVSVTAVDFGTTDSVTFNWAVTGAAQLTGLTPGSAPEGSGPLALGIAGTGFQSGHTSVTITGSATAAVTSVTLTPSIFTSSSSITVNVPVALLEEDGPLSVVVVIPDGSGVPTNTLTSNAETFAITPPLSLTISYPGSPFTSLANSSVSVSSTNTDPNVLDWQASGLPSGLTINHGTGVISGTLSPTTVVYTDTVVVTASDDGTQGSDTFAWTVTPDNQPPTFSVADPDQTVTVDNGPNVASYSVPNWATAIQPGPSFQDNETVHFNVVLNDSDPSLFTSAGQPKP